MNALVRHGPEPYGLRMQEMPEPEAKPEWVVLRVAACGICGSDIHGWQSKQPQGKPYPYVVGHEFAGTIADLGEGVTGFEVGDRVASEPFAVWCGECRMCRRGRVNNCRQHSDLGFGQQGAFTEYVAAPARGLHRLPESVEVEDAAICEPLAVSYNGMFAESRVRPGDLVVVLGCGPIGLLCSALALAAGGEVLATGWTGDDARLGKARAIGVHHVVNSAEEDVLAKVREMTDPDGPDLIVDAVGGNETFGQALEMAGPCGQITKIGWFRGGEPLNLNPLVGKNLRIHGVYGHTWEVWEQCMQVLAAGQIPLEHIATHRLPLSQWERGFQLMQDREAVKVLLRPEVGHGG
ncbi:MAG: zinc-binding dehydrogenase [Armatimonadota bacterium]